MARHWERWRRGAKPMMAKASGCPGQLLGSPEPCAYAAGSGKGGRRARAHRWKLPSEPLRRVDLYWKRPGSARRQDSTVGAEVQPHAGMVSYLSAAPMAT